MRIKQIMPVVLVFLSLFLMVSCGGKKAVKVDESFDAEKYLARADQQVNSKDYEEARKTLLEVKNRDLSKKYAPLAQLKIADSHMREGDPDIAIEEYKRFLEIYPQNQYASYAQYQIAMAYFTQIEAADRGSGAAQKALKEFRRLKEVYPRNPYREVIELRTEKCKNVIADGEFLVAEFYYKKGSYEAAINRLRGLLEKSPEYKKADETLFLLAKCYKALKKDDKAKEMVLMLQEKFPSSKFSAEAKKKL